MSSEYLEKGGSFLFFFYVTIRTAIFRGGFKNDENFLQQVYHLYSPRHAQTLYTAPFKYYTVNV